MKFLFVPSCAAAQGGRGLTVAPRGAGHGRAAGEARATAPLAQKLKKQHQKTFS